MERRRTPGSLNLVQAGEVLSLPPDVVRALADAGYLRASEIRAGVPRFALGDLKAFQARALEGSAVAPAFGDDLDDSGLDPEELVEALEGRAEEMAERALALFATVYPEAADYDDAQRARFLDEAALRIDAIITLCARGPRGGEPIELDLAEIGADAAHAGVPLPGVLLALRISRDLVVRTATEIAEDRGRHWGLALAIVLTRVLPAIDRLADAVARGYWEAVLEIEAESLERYRNVVEQATDGVVEIDVRGCIRYANRSFGELVGVPADAVVGFPMSAFLGPVELGAPVGELTIRRDDGVERTLLLRQFERVREGVCVGWDAVAQDVTAERRDGRRREDQLRILAGELAVARRVVALRPTLSAAVEAAAGRRSGVKVDVPKGLRALADGRRVEEVVTELVTNAVRHGRAPVRVSAHALADSVRIVVSDGGPGLPHPVRAELTAELRPLSGVPRRRAVSTVTGLGHARTLVEVMGGHLAHERDHPTTFAFTLPGAP